MVALPVEKCKNTKKIVKVSRIHLFHLHLYCFLAIFQYDKAVRFLIFDRVLVLFYAKEKTQQKHVIVFLQNRNGFWEKLALKT